METPPRALSGAPVVRRRGSAASGEWLVASRGALARAFTTRGSARCVGGAAVGCLLVTVGWTLGVGVRFSTIFGLRLARAAPTVSTFPSDRRHVRSIAAYRFATFTTGYSSFVGREFMRSSLGVSCPAAFARDFALLGRIHRRKTALTGVCHEGVSFGLQFWYSREPVALA